MIRHIVFFKLTDFESSEAKWAKMTEIKNALENLKTIIPVIRNIHVGLNINEAETWDVALVTEFDTMENLHFYATHPSHVAVGKNIIGPVKKDRACVDYEF